MSVVLLIRIKVRDQRQPGPGYSGEVGRGTTNNILPRGAEFQVTTLYHVIMCILFVIKLTEM